MSFLGRAWRYVVRKKIKTVVIFAVLTAMTTMLLVANAVRQSTNKSADEVATKTGAVFTLGNNAQFNLGTPRGAGTVKPADIDKIAKLEAVERYVVRQNIFADLVNAKMLRIARNDYSAEKEAKFGNAVQVWGVNGTEWDTNFRSGALKLSSGRHLVPSDSHKSVIHEELAKANGLQLGSKLTLKGNPYDADNQKKSTTEVETEIVGLVSGSNNKQVTHRAELFANTVFTDLDTTRDLQQVSPETEIYQDANFFVAKNADFDQVFSAAAALDIDWHNYQLSRGAQYFSGITGAIDGVRAVMNSTTVATIIFSILVLSLVLFLWMNERKKETGVLTAIGTSKISILFQYLAELVITAIPATIAAYFIAGPLAQKFGNSVLDSVNKSALKELSSTAQISADMESSMATRTLESLTVNLSTQTILIGAGIGLCVIVVCVCLAAIPMLRKSPKSLLVNIA